VGRGIALLCAAVWLVGCGESDPPAETTPPVELSCATGEIIEGDACIAPGVRACADGFLTDGDGGCRAVLPDEPCPSGLIAVPGDTTCREIAACGEGTWGDIPVEANTQFVNAAYAGGDSDGSAAQPWTTIQEAVIAAAPSAIVAVAAGSYLEAVRIEDKPVRLWGRCPAMVEIVGPTALPFAAVQVFTAAHGSEIHAVALTGAGLGLTALVDVRAEHLWIHDTAGLGVVVQRDLGDVALELNDSLIERTVDVAIFVTGNAVTMDRTAVRDTFLDAQGLSGKAFSLRETGGIAGVAVVRGCLFERAREGAIAVVNSDALIEASVIRDTLPRDDGSLGRGLSLEGDLMSSTARATLVSSLLAGNTELGALVAGAELVMVDTTVRDTLPAADDQGLGRGIHAQKNQLNQSLLTIEHSLIDANFEAGLSAWESIVTLRSSIVRSTAPEVRDGDAGDGIVLWDQAAQLTLLDSLVDSNARAGVSNFGGSAVIGNTRLRCNVVDLDGEAVPGAFSFDDLGDNGCGCDDEPLPCKVLTTSLSPPKAVE
jgi:hypothetical protein